jgi:hypothetical protein
MAQDLTGLLGGALLPPAQPAALTSAQDRTRIMQEANKGFSQAVGSMFGVDTRTTAEFVQEEVAKLNPESVEDQAKIVELVGKINPAGAVALKSAFAKKAAEKDILTAQTTAKTEQAEAIAKGLDATHPQLAASIRLGNQAAMTKGIEILGAPPKEEKIYPPEIKQVGDEFVTISTNPDTVGAVINRTSAKSEAVVAQEKEVERQKKAQYTQDLVIKRNALIEQAAAVRLAVKTVIDDSILSPEQSMALQKQSPIYGAFIGGSTYANLENAIAPIKSAQALTAIADLKAKSSTGATGLGATNAMEFSALQDNIARLDAALPDTIEPTLQAIEKNLGNLLKISQGLEPDINWDDPAYAHMVSETSDGKRVYTYDGYTFYEVPANPPATE